MIFITLVLLMALTLINTVLSFMNPEFRVNDSMSSRKKMLVKRNLLAWRIMSAASFIFALVAFICSNVLWS